MAALAPGRERRRRRRAGLRRQPARRARRDGAGTGERGAEGAGRRRRPAASPPWRRRCRGRSGRGPGTRRRAPSAAPLHSSPASANWSRSAPTIAAASRSSGRAAVVADHEGVGGALGRRRPGRRSRRRREPASPPGRRLRLSSPTMAPPSSSPKKARWASLGPGACGREADLGGAAGGRRQLGAGAVLVEQAGSCRQSPPATMPMKKPAGMLPELVRVIVCDRADGADRDRAEVGRVRRRLR